MLSNEINPEEDGLFSQSTQSDERSGEPLPRMSTPDLSFATSSSPCRFPATDSPSLLTTSSDYLRGGNVASRFPLPSDHASFQHLDYLWQQAADQQCHLETSENSCIQPDFPKEGPASACQIVHDTVPESALGPTEYDSSVLAVSLPESQISSSLLDHTSDNHTLSTVYDAVYDSRRNKRKAQAANHEDSRTRVTSLFHNEIPCDSYLSASDGASPAPSCRPDVRYPHSKKRKCLSLDDTNLIRLESPSVAEHLGVDSNTAFHCKRDELHSHRHSTFVARSRSVSPYPPTEPATPVPGCSPVPVIKPQDFPKADIPHFFRSSDEAAKARIMALLRKEALHFPGEGPGGLVALDLASQDSVTEVIAWILKVEPPLGSPTESESSVKGGYILMTYMNN
ncbi:hypothetical protein BJV74DRAFT_455488 [Russula compacta]|nr:hypothetical protein BJV74DRAFT_455488 [Russula compacta]